MALDLFVTIPAHCGRGEVSVTQVSLQVCAALQKLLVFGVVPHPAQRLTRFLPHARVGQAHCQGHEGLEVVGVELQTPAHIQREASKEPLLLMDTN